MWGDYIKMVKTTISYNDWRVCEVPNEVRDLGGRGATPEAVYPLVIGCFNGFLINTSKFFLILGTNNS